MNIELIALDLDGTLTDSKKEVSLRNRETVGKALEKGVQIALVSGRPVMGILPVARKLDLFEKGGYILAFNGGHILHCEKDQDGSEKLVTLKKEVIPLSCVPAIASVLGTYEVFPLTYNDIGVISENDENRYVKLEAYNNAIPVIRVPDLTEAVKEPVVKFMIVGEPEKLKPAGDYLKNALGEKVNIFYSEPYFMEVTAPGIDKYSSLEWLSKKLNISREQVMACGDGLNDIPMLKFAGLSVVMGNAYDETKKYADHIVSTNDEDGVAEAIERFVLS